MSAYASVYLADVVLTGVSKEPVVTIQILDSDRHQRASGCLPLTDKTADKNADENLGSLLCRFKRLQHKQRRTIGKYNFRKGDGEMKFREARE